jgi:aromatase
MHQANTRAVEHEITVSAPASTVYRYIADVSNWPLIFPPTVYVDYAERTAREERIRIWATANNEIKNWTSRRTLDPDGQRITFRQEVSAPPVAAMGGAWVVEPTTDSQSRVRLLHDYRAVNDDPDKLAWIDAAVDGNSKTELAALKANAERAATAGDLLLSFEDTVRINGSLSDVYDFLNDADLWPQRLPHVARVSMREDAPGTQVLEMDTRAKDGSTHTTTSVRVCFPKERIVYKQIVPPALMALHTGHWRLSESNDCVEATSQHTVMINSENVAAVLGPDASVAQARALVRSALSTNSMTTLTHAKAYAESRHRFQ